MRIALAGNPNSGKTTMYNALTGQSEKVGNWAGVTVEKKEHPIKKSLCAGEAPVAVDLPGAYSMSPFTSEESITSEYVRREAPDVILNIVDATNLSRSLFFTTQLLELNIPVVVALNKSDVNKKKKTEIDASKLSEKLGCPVIETAAGTGDGIKEAVDAVLASVGREQKAPFSGAEGIADREAAEAEDRLRFEFVNRLVRRVETRRIFTKNRNAGDKIDALLTNRWFGLPIFALIMLGVFWLSQSGPAVWLADFLVGILESGQEWLASAVNSESVWASILIDGIVGGFIAIVGFLPLVMVMYFLIALLEDCGYMARATVVLDPIFKRVGLSGKSVIPFIIGTGCAIPGVMACRTIRDERERRATAMLAPFMPCGAKLPVITLFAGSFFNRELAALIGALMYFAGILVIFLSALLVNAVTGHKGKKSYFIMELPDYKLPSLSKALSSMCQRGWSYIVKAGTVILVCNFAIHLMQNFTPSFTPAVSASDSILSIVAAPFAYIIAPIVGVAAWQLAAAAVTGFIAKENVVGTVSVCYGIANLFNLDDLEVLEGSESLVAETIGITSVAALAFLMFNLFTPPCFAAIGAMRSELKSGKWLAGAILLQLSVGYTVGFLTFFFGTLITGGSLGEPWMPVLGWSVVLLIAAVFTALIVKQKNKLKTEAAK